MEIIPIQSRLNNATVNRAAWLLRAFRRPGIAGAMTDRRLQVGLAVFLGAGTGLAVIISTHFAENFKLVFGLVGAVVFVLVTMRWPELGILSLVALLSGMISLSWLPVLPLGPVSLNIHDMIVMLLLALVFLRATSWPGFTIYRTPLLLPLLLFVGAFLLSAANAILIHGVGMNAVLRTVRVLILWIAFIPTMQLVRDEQALRRLLLGLLLFSVVLLIGVLLPNKFEPFLPVEERAAGTGAQMYSGVTRVYFAGDMILYAMIPVTVAALATVKKGNPLWRVGLLGLLLFWLFRTFFRQYWLTLFVACLLLMVFLSGQERLRLLKRMIPVALAGALIVGIFVAFQPEQFERMVHPLVHRISSITQNPFKREGSLQWRMIETHYAMIQIERHPVLGLGLASSYRPPMESEGDMYGDWAYKYIENGYLYITVMMGLVGLVPFLWLCAVYLFRVARHQHEIGDDGLRAVYLGFGLAFLGMMACNIFSPTFVIGTRLVFFPVSMAISETILRLEREKKALR